MRILNWLVLAIIPTLFSSCYYYEIAKGQAEITFSKQKIEDIVAKPAEYKKTISPDEIKQLEAVLKIKEFARSKLGLNSSSSYKYYYHSDKPGITHVLTAAYPDRFETYFWEYPIIGKLPYQGFFYEKSFMAEQERLQAENLDIWPFYATAYSTLGWFSDPVTTQMLNQGMASLADIIIHELVHESYFFEGQGDFNEQLASFVGNKAGQQFMLEFYPEVKPEEPDPKSTIFINYLHEVKKELNAIYSSKISYDQKIALKSRLQKAAYNKIAELYPQSDERFRTVNNARLIQLARYSPSSNELEEVYQRAGQDWKMFWEILVIEKKLQRGSLITH